MSAITCSHCGHTPKYCANCGRPLAQSLTGQPSSGGGWSLFARKHGWNVSQPMESSTAWSAPPAARLDHPGSGSSSAYRRTPARPPTVQSDVVTPLLKGLAVGASVGVLVIIPTVFVPSWPWYTPLLAWGVASPLAVIGFIFHHQGGLWVTEEVSSEPAELPALAPTSTPTPPVELEVIHKDSDNRFQRMLRFELPHGVDEAQFYNFAKGITDGGRTLAQTDWTGSSRPFSKPKYQELLNRLTEAGVVAFIDPDAPTVGRKITRAGRAGLARFCQSYELQGRQA